MEEKRKFFRISDSIFLSYQLIDKKDFDDGVLRLRSSIDQQQKLSDSLQNVSELLSELLGNLEKTQPEVVRAIKLLDHKTTTISKAVGAQINDDGKNTTTRSTYELNLSGGGLSFKSAERINVGDLLELNLILFPEIQPIRSFGEVVHCHKDKSQPALNQYNIGIEFTYITEHDRGLIVSHVLNTQSSQLRMSKTPTPLE